MKEMDCVEVINEKDKYAKEGVHIGMQGWICDPLSIEGTWLVNFPQYGEQDDIATLPIKEDDLRLLPDGMNAKINEEIKVRFDAPKEADTSFVDRNNLSDYMI